jgi:bacteriorhodopsin
MDLEKRNDAVSVNDNFVNGALADIAITSHGSSFYFAICALMGAAAIIFLVLAAMRPRTQRVFHYITAAICMVACIAYFTMGSNLGFTPIGVEYHRSDPEVAGNNRAIFYARYIDWVITTPLLLLDLLLTAGMPWPSIFMLMLVDEIMIVTGLIGALVESRYKWGFYAFGCAALLFIVWELVITCRKHASHIGADVGRAYLYCGALTTFLWILYPIAWGVSEGGNLIAPDSEAVFYGILDLLAKPVFGALLIWGHRGIDSARLGLHVRDVTGLGGGTEKHHTTTTTTTGPVV